MDNFMTPQDFITQQEIVKRKRMEADALRQRAMNPDQRKGQMVGRHYVAPDIIGQMQPLLAGYLAQKGEKAAGAAEQGYNQRVEGAKQQWQSALPKAVAQQTAPFMAPGMDGPEPLGETITQKAEPLTTERILKHTLAGMDIPGNERAAGLYNAGAMGDLAREDAQAARLEEREAATVAAAARQQEQLAARLEELKVKMEDRALDRASREQMARDARALQAELGRGNLAIRQMLADTAKQTAEGKAAEAKDKAIKTTEGEKSSAGYLTRMNEAEAVLGTVGSKGDMNLAQKAVGGIPMIGKDLQPYVLGKDREKTLQAQRDWVRAKLRKESGAVIGQEEMAEEIRTYFPQPGESADVAAQKAAARQAAARQLEIGAGAAMSEANMGTRGGATGSWDAPAPGTVKNGYVFLGGDPASPSSWRKQ